MATPMKKWLCVICGLIYDEAKGWPSDGIAPGTRWEDVPDDWMCPDCFVGKSDFEMIAISETPVEEAAPVEIAKEDPIVIIGTGYAGYRLAEAIRQRKPEQPIVMFSSDDGADYSKPGLSNALARDKGADELITETALEIEQRLNIRIYARCKVQNIDTEARLLQTDFGSQRYAKLVFATGAAPIQLSFDGDGAGDVLSVNDLEDYRQFRKRLKSVKDLKAGQHVTLIGNGLIGCEFANDLAAAGYPVTVVGLTGWPMDRLLPQQIGEQLQSQLSTLGVQWQLNNTVQRIDRLSETDCLSKSGEEANDGNLGYRLTLADGTELETSLVLSAVGLKPRTELAEQAGIKCNRGIVINGGLRTSANNVYALGDCAEINGQLMPYIAPINFGIPALADCMLGRPTMAQYPLMPVMVKTPALPLTLLSAAPETEGQWHVEQSENGMRALFVDHDDLIRGFALAGDLTSERQHWVDEIKQGQRYSLLKELV